MPHAIAYVITPENPQAHLFKITCTINRPNPTGQVVWLPAWIPGSYMIRDFAKNIVTLSASAEIKTIAVAKLDKQTWRCAPCQGPLHITYSVYAWDLSVRSAHLDTLHGFFNGSSVFLAVEGQEEDPLTVEIHLPPGKAYQDWRVATSLPRDGAALFSAGRYQAANYEELIDHPVEMGRFSEVTFDVAGVPHHIVITGRHFTDMQRLAADVQHICTRHVQMFGELPSMERYVFLLMVVDAGYGGLEHRSSSALICCRDDLPTSHMDKVSEKYMTLLGLFSHEYFHTWNIKRIKPKTFIPYQLTQESYTKQLWAFEGITSYYDDLGLMRSGVINENEYLTLLGKNITRVMRGSGRLKQSLTESSFDAWTKFYKQDENSPNAIVSYYAKGAMFALCLDLMIRQQSEHRYSLDDVMRHLWLEYGKTGKGLDDDTIVSMIQTVTGIDMHTFFDDYLTTTRDLPLASLLASMGVQLKQRETQSLEDQGGTSSKPNNSTAPAFDLGARFIPDNSGAKIQFVYEDGCLMDAGIAANDVIVAVNELKANKDNIMLLLQANKPGDKVPFHVFRRDELMCVEVTLRKARLDTYYLEVDSDELSTPQRKVWLTGS